MKIVMLAPEFLPVWGGVGTYTVELVRHLPKDIEIHIITPLREGFGKEKVSSDRNFSNYFKSNVHVHFASTAKDTFFYNAQFQYACLKKVPKLIKEEKIDLIHSHTAQMPDLLLMLRKLRIPTVTTVHTTVEVQRLGTKASRIRFSNLEKSEKATYIMYPFLRLAEDAYFKLNRFYVSPSHWMENWLRKNHNINGNLVVIPNSVDLDDYNFHRNRPIDTPLIPQEFVNKKIILFVGRLLALKGVDTIIEAIPAVLERFGKNNILFVFAGPGEPSRYLSKIKEKKISASCLFTGSLPRDKISMLMKAAEIVVAPSLVENAPYTILESMACGVPVVATNVGGVSEIIEDGYNGKLVEMNSPKMVAETLINLLEDTSLKSSMGQHAFETIKQKFSWDVNLKKYCQVYANIVNKNSEWGGQN